MFAPNGSCWCCGPNAQYADGFGSAEWIIYLLRYDTNTPTNSPSTAPTTAPTLTAVALDHYISMDCTLSDLSGSEIEFVSDSLVIFVDGLSVMVSMALNDQMLIEHQPVTVNITKLNGVEIEKVALSEPADRDQSVKRHSDSLTMRSYVNCTNDRGECDYITTTVLEWPEFKKEMTTELREYFELNAINISTATFSVHNHSNAISMNLTVTESRDSTETADHSLNTLFIAISAMIAMVGVSGWCYQRGLIPSVKRRVDHSDWISWIALALSFWDLVSDISLCSELWTKRALMDDGWERRRISIAAIGYTAATTIPFVCCMMIACTIKRRVKRLRNQSASTWSACLCIDM